MYLVPSDHQLRRFRIGTKRKNLTLNAIRLCAFANLINHLLDTTNSLGQISLEKMQYSHQDLRASRYVSAVMRAQCSQENA